MKVKDLKGINPEAEIKIVMANGLTYEGNLTFGWVTENDVDPIIDTKSITKEVDIFLEDISEIDVQ